MKLARIPWSLVFLLLSFFVPCCHAWSQGITQFQLPPGSAPLAITAGPDGALWFTESGTDKIGRLTVQLTFSEFGLAAGSTPYGICAGPDGAVWFTESDTDKIGRITVSGNVSEFQLTAGAAPHGIASGSDGNLWFTEFSGNKIGRITPAGGITEFDPLGPNSGLEDITLGPDGDLWYTETNIARIGRISTSGTIAEFPVPNGQASIAITSAPDGNLYFTPNNSNEIIEWLEQTTPAGVIKLVAENTGDWPYNPRRVTVGSDGNLWFTQNGGDEFARMAPAQTSWTNLYEVLTFPLPMGSGAQGIANGPDGQLWLAETSVDKIGAMAPADFSMEFPTNSCNPSLCPPFVEGLSNAGLVAVIRNGHDTTTQAFNAAIDWGDGTPPSTGTIAGGPTTFTVAGSHLYAEFGQYNANIRVTRDASVTAVLHNTLTVQDARDSG